MHPDRLFENRLGSKPVRVLSQDWACIVLSDLTDQVIKRCFRYVALIYTTVIPILPQLAALASGKRNAKAAKAKQVTK